MGDGGLPCFLVGADTLSGAIHATMVLDSKKMDMPYVVVTTSKRVRDVEYYSTQKINDMNYNQLFSDLSACVKKRAQRSDDSILLRHMGGVAGTGPEEHLMSDFETHEDQSVFDRCGGVAP